MSAPEVLTTDEHCRNCKAPAREMHPACVIAGRWRCTRCCRWQDDVAGVRDHEPVVPDANAPNSLVALYEFLEGID